MPERRVTVAFPEGLHARPAALFARLAGAQPASVTIRKGDAPPVPASSVLSVMGLGAKCGDEVVLEAEGAQADESLSTLEGFLTTPE